MTKGTDADPEHSAPCQSSFLDSGEDALRYLREQIFALTLRGVENCDAVNELMQSPVLESLAKTIDQLIGREKKLPWRPVSEKHFNVCEFDAALALLQSKGDHPVVSDLLPLIDAPCFRALVVTYDAVARREFLLPGAELVPGLNYLNGNPQETIRIVGLRKPKNVEYLGITVREESGHLIVARVLDESPVSKQGLIHVGDTILEVNGAEVKTVEQMQAALNASDDAVQLKLIPSPFDYPPTVQAYVKAFFDYDPKEDPLLPCADIGLSFHTGDILQIISKDDENWWQARKVYDTSRIGLIPSQKLEEQRKAECSPEKNQTKKHALGGLITVTKKRKVMYNSKRTTDFDQHELLIYEEVGRLSPFGRRVLVLIGASGVGRRTLKSRLLRYDPVHFTTVVPYTSRPKRDGETEGREYFFRSQSEMQREIEEGRYLEWGEYGGNYYGTTLQSVRDAVRTGKLCILDCSPQAIKYLYSWEFMPYICFIAPPQLDELKELYATQSPNFRSKGEVDLVKTCDDSAKLDAALRHYFDLVLVNRNSELTFRKLLDSLEMLKSQPQWVPISWLLG